VGIDPTRLKQAHAASDFEALLISQMLKSIRTEGAGWLGTGDDQSSDDAFGLGEEQLAKALATSGGFGLSKLIESGLRSAERSAQAAQPGAPPPSKSQAETAKR
jgi:Rod binding domain-containing protein